MMPQDPMILYSWLNTKLRDEYPSLEELCAAEGADLNEITAALDAIGFSYDPQKNRFV